MTIIDTTLYADGTLRLARHGAGRGGNILTYTPTGEQCELTDEKVALLTARGVLSNFAAGPKAIFDVIRSVHAIKVDREPSSEGSSRYPGWYHG